jgi:hypothetical protein
MQRCLPRFQRNWSLLEFPVANRLAPAVRDGPPYLLQHVCERFLPSLAGHLLEEVAGSTEGTPER